MAAVNNEVVGVEQAPAPKVPKYKVVGLEISDHMPVEHKGVMYDFAKLTDEQLEFLKKDDCQYLFKG